MLLRKTFVRVELRISVAERPNATQEKAKEHREQDRPGQLAPSLGAFSNSGGRVPAAWSLVPQYPTGLDLAESLHRVLDFLVYSISSG